MLPSLIAKGITDLVGFFKGFNMSMANGRKRGAIKLELMGSSRKSQLYLSIPTLLAFLKCHILRISSIRRKKGTIRRKRGIPLFFLL
jgi:hypothetical protein